MEKRISLIQMDVSFENPSANFRKAEGFIEEAMKDKPDFICLPETWNTGFFPKEELEKLADENGNTTKKFLSKLSKKHNVNIIGGSVAVKRGDQVYNTSYIFNREGTLVAEYDKIHGFSPSGENEYFKGGENLCVFEIDGVKAGIVICYDLRFLELIRSLALKGIDILFLPAQWPHPRLNHWKTLSVARAIENQMFVAAVNALGTNGKLEMCGNSMIIDPWGNILVNAEEEEKIVTSVVDFEIVKDIRNRINVFKDRKPHLYQL
ncbi:carbon-nitrogen family hydrolase [Maledivibacter halophilus]|uniref:Carbon-nitrogen hydrolase n=1 Tax=Maledivibacter halophilus TaxID=36842 RepID=A0A1T5MDP1_9FIRM|nr:carbon-nitrogen family hydrolase [Maledivibacter halophilus]SKC86265.1 Carbon-nitrogen hydrolase [Maledivibacter halophilus]